MDTASFCGTFGLMMKCLFAAGGPMPQPQTFTDLFLLVTTDDAAVDTDQAKLTADKERADFDHHTLNSVVAAIGRPVVVLSADGSTATILSPNPDGTTGAVSAVLGTAPLPAAPAQPTAPASPTTPDQPSAPAQPAVSAGS